MPVHPHFFMLRKRWWEPWRLSWENSWARDHLHFWQGTTRFQLQDYATVLKSWLLQHAWLMKHKPFDNSWSWRHPQLAEEKVTFPAHKTLAPTVSQNTRVRQDQVLAMLVANAKISWLREGNLFCFPRDIHVLHFHNNTLTITELCPGTSGRTFQKWYWAGHSSKNGEILITLQSIGAAL